MSQEEAGLLLLMILTLGTLFSWTILAILLPLLQALCLAGINLVILLIALLLGYCIADFDW